MATSIWGSNGGVAATPAATNRIPTDISSGGAPNHHTLQQLADLGASIGVTTQALGSINTNTTITWSSGSYVTATIAGALTFTFAGAPSSGQGFQGVLVLTNGGSAVITWPVSVTWSGGTAPTLRASGVDLLRFYTEDNGTTWFGTAENDESNVAGSDTQVLFNDAGSLAGDSGLTYNKTTDTLTVAGPVIRSGSGTRILVGTGTGASDICLWTTTTGLIALNGNNSFVQTFRAATITADSAFVNSSGGLQYGGAAFGWGSVTSTLTAFVRHTASEICVTGATTTYDTILTRDAANTLALRNSTNAQTFRVYRSYTDASNYSRWTVKWNTSTAILQAEGAGTGTNGSTAFGNAALATNATVGFLMIPSCAGTPTGTPADIPTGQAPIVYDSTNKKLCVWDGAAWVQTAALT